MNIPFVPLDKIPRLRREIVITEKIDGTNAQVHVAENGEVFAGSRNRWITPEDDNYGFARWVKANEAALREGLGIGTHSGEWWGSGIQRGYGLKEKRFSLFNVSRWGAIADIDRTAAVVPPIGCCHVVPRLYVGRHTDEAINGALHDLRTKGSVASPGFMRPEGIVVYHVASRSLFKVTLENDDSAKGAA